MIIHLVAYEEHALRDDAWDIEIALCGQTFHIGPEPEFLVLPEDHDFVYLPDTKHIADCGECLASQADRFANMRREAVKA